MSRGELTELVKARIDADTKAAVVRVANQTGRSEGAIVRNALKAYGPVKDALRNDPAVKR